MNKENILKNLLNVGMLSIAVCFGLVFYNIAEHTLNKYRILYDNQSTVPYDITTHNQMRELECLTKNIYYEAGVESFEGKVAVAQVTINRVQSRDFPKSICGVVYQKNVFYEKVVCQFSWYCNSPSKLRNINKAVYNESEEVAKKVLFENFRLRSLEQAIYYHADYVRPGWKYPQITKIGHHIFYKG